MDEEKRVIGKNFNFIIDLLCDEKETHKHDDNPLSSASISSIPPAISSLIPPSPHRDHIQIGLLQKNDRRITENVKAKYMNDLFQRLESQPDEIVTECMNKVYANMESIIAYYDQNCDTHFGGYYFRDDSLPSIMVLDACYILELIYKWSENNKRKGDSLGVKYDLVRLDNQIPFFVLQHIFECTLFKLMKPPTIATPSLLPNLILDFLKNITPFELNVVADDDTKDYKHILDLLYQSYKPQDASSSDLLSHVTTIFSARELAKAGMKFNPSPINKRKIEMKFRSSWCNATLTMPTMRIEESTSHVLCNLAAYERLYPAVGNYITSYVFGMKMLLDTKEDVLKLVESNICRNSTGHQYIVDLIHGLCRDVALTDFLYAKEWHKMGKYCNSRLGLTRRTYFSGAWSYIASISALILFILTVIQTYSSIRTL